MSKCSIHKSNHSRHYLNRQFRSWYPHCFPFCSLAWAKYLRLWTLTAEHFRGCCLELSLQRLHHCQLIGNQDCQPLNHSKFGGFNTFKYPQSFRCDITCWLAWGNNNDSSFHPWNHLELRRRHLFTLLMDKWIYSNSLRTYHRRLQWKNRILCACDKLNHRLLSIILYL